MIGRRLLLGLFGLGGCFTPDAVTGTDGGGTTDAVETTQDASTDAPTETSTATEVDPTSEGEEDSTGSCPNGAFDRTACDESCFVE